MEQDIRILQFRNFYEVKSLSHRSGANSYQTFSYFDQISVHPISPAEGQTDSFISGYDAMQSLFRAKDEVPYRSQQLIMAFTDVKSKKERLRIDDFWASNHNALFFVTMVNVTLDASLEDILKHIARIYRGKNYLVYYTFEYNQLLIFYKGDRFDDYSELVMRLNYDVSGAMSNGIVDTITVCGFSEHARNISDEKFDAYLRLGTNCYEDALRCIEGQMRPNAQKVSHVWLLGRNDVGILLKQTSLKQLYEIYQQYNPEKPWISTFDLSVWVEPRNEDRLRVKTALELNPDADEMKAYRDIQDTLRKAIAALETKYAELCARNDLGIKIDRVFLRILYDIESMVSNIQTLQLAKDLTACLIPQFIDFIRYMHKSCETALENPEEARKNDFADQLQETLNTFYLNVTTLINSTVHSDRQFIQIPHCGVTAFEMPPKIMAYYSLMAHRIVAAFQEDPSVSYGVMLSPKLVGELEVEPLPLSPLSEPHQMISVNISEKMMYQPRRTVAILGHEIAHFVGNDQRQRPLRKEQVGAYYIRLLLQDVFLEYRKCLHPTVREPVERYIPTERLQDFSMDLSKQFFLPHYQDPAYKRVLRAGIAKLPRKLLMDKDCLSRIINEAVFPTDGGRPLFLNTLIEHMSDRGMVLQNTSWETMPDCDRAQLRAHSEAVFSEALQHCWNMWSASYLEKTCAHFDNVTGYLFSEAYADLEMILLFDMKPQDYIRLFISGLKDSQREFARFQAVARALRKCGVWTEKDLRGAKPSGRGKWSSTLRKILTLSLSMGEYDEYRTALESSPYPIDLPLQSFLIEYLTQCIDSVKAQLRKSENAVQIIRYYYCTVDPSKSAKKSLMAIMELEKEQVKGWEMNSIRPSRK